MGDALFDALACLRISTALSNKVEFKSKISMEVIGAACDPEEAQTGQYVVPGSTATIPR